MKLPAIRNRLPAAALVLSVAACGGSEPAGEQRPEPAPEPGPGTELDISVSPGSATTGADVTIRGQGFEPGTRVEIGFGPVQSEFEVFAEATANADGTVETTVSVPDWAEQGRDYVFVAVTPDREKVISPRFRLTSDGGDPGDPGDPGDSGDPGDPAEAVTVTGVLTDEGVECPALRTDQGELYTLTGETGAFGVGDRVTVEGTIAEMSFCMQGTTLQVTEISAAD